MINNNKKASVFSFEFQYFRNQMPVFNIFPSIGAFLR